MNPTLLTLAHVVLWLAVAAMGLLAFVWPFVVSPDPAQPHLEALAITVLCAFIAAMAAILLDKACRAPRT